MAAVAVEMTGTAVALLAVLAVVFTVNLLPAFGPPNVLLVVFFGVNWDIDPVPLVVVAAVASGAGRYVLAAASNRVGENLHPQRRANLQAACGYLTGRRDRRFATLGLFLISPLPSAQMFEAAGLMGLPLVPITAAHITGRLVSFSVYLTAVDVAARSLGDTLSASLTSPYGIVAQIVLMVGVVGLARVDWHRYLPAVQERKR